MTRKTNHISILQFDERSISRLRVRRSGKGIELLSHDLERGEWSPRDGSLENALKAFAQKHQLQDDFVYTVLPRYDMTARILDLPSQDLAEIEGMVRLSAEEYVPFSADELITHQCVIERTANGGSKVLAVFAHRDVVEGHVKILQAAQVDPEQIFLSTACLASLAMAAREDRAHRFALVNLASGGLEVLVMHDRRFVYGRAVASQQDWGRTGDAAQEVLEELSVEVRASLSAYRRESEDGEDVENVYLCSGSVDVADLGEALYHDLGVECSPASFALDVVTQGADQLHTLPLVALGAALIAQDRGAVAIHLMPRSLLRTRERAGAKREFRKFGVLAAAILVALIALYAEAVYQRNGYIRRLKTEIAKIEPHAKDIISKQRQLRILQHQVDRSGSVIELLAALIDQYPESDMNISRFVFTHKEKIEVVGRTKTLKAFELLTQKLTEIGKSAIPQFARAQQVYEQEVNEKGQQVWDYKVIMPFPETMSPSADSDSGSDGLE